MASNDLGTLQFRGTDAKECEEFISAIVKHAYEQGKLRDDEWIADFVATCLTQDALRWWSGLDDETQWSWKRLRQAMFARYQPKFYGKSGEEAEQFVHLVRQRARDAGKQKDNDWIITFVEDCLVGDALRWHVSLDQSIQGDWKTLQLAILVQYTREGGFDISRKMPTPASAASAPPKLKKGRVRVCKKNETNFSFLSKKTASFGLRLTSSAAEALVVEYDPSTNDPQTLLISNGQIPGFDILGARWNGQDTKSASSYAYTCAINSKNDSVSLDSRYNGRQMRKLWNISSTTQMEPGQLLQVVVMDETATLVTRTASSPEYIWFRTGPMGHDFAVDLFLEPV